MPPQTSTFLPALLNVIDRCSRKPSKKCGVEFFIGIDDIDQMMAHTLLVGPRRLAGADIHVTIDLLRVGIDDLAADALRQLLRRPRFCPQRWVRG